MQVVSPALKPQQGRAEQHITGIAMTCLWLAEDMLTSQRMLPAVVMHNRAAKGKQQWKRAFPNALPEVKAA